mgnify:CR=1 FL=1
MLNNLFSKRIIGIVLLLSFILLLTACGAENTTTTNTTNTNTEDTNENTSQSEEEVSNSAETDYPTKPITVLQGFKAGGGSDQLAQMTQPYLSEILGESFVNEYIPGATGAIAWTQLAKQTENDGYTLSITNTPMLMTNYIMNSEINYSIEELEPIANVVTDPGVIVVSSDSPFDTYEDFAEYVKEHPGEVTAGNSGTGGDDFFTQLQWMQLTGLEIEMVPFEGDGPSWQAAAGNQTDASFTNLGVVYSQIKSGNLKALALFTEERYELLPDVPTLKELGIDIISGSSRGYSAPKGIPEDIKQVLIDAFEEMSQDSEFQQGLKDIALPMDIKLGDEYKQYLEDEEKKFTDIWNEVKDQYQKELEK